MQINNDIIINNNYQHLISSNEKQNANINDSPPTLICIPAQVILIVINNIHIIIYTYYNILSSLFKIGNTKYICKFYDQYAKQRENICKL